MILSKNVRCFGAAFITATALLGVGHAQAADAPVPSGAHPRLFMTADDLATFTANAQSSSTVTASIIAKCQDTIANPTSYTMRNGADSDVWPGAAMSCALAYLVTQKQQYLTQALTYWQTALNDDQTMGDNLGCVAGVSTNWQSWNLSPPAPPVLITITHDTGYSLRWYGPYLSLTYDWLYNAPGVSESLRAQTRTCLTNWMDYYSMSGYLHDVPGANYNAGFILGKTLAAIAIGNDGGADGHLWTQSIHTTFEQLLVGMGLSGSTGGIGDPAGIMVGGDWGSWQYGPLSIIEYALAARVMEENGVPQPEMDSWTNSLIVRNVYGTLPEGDSQFAGNGDFDSPNIYQDLSGNQVDAVLAGPSSDQAAGWALSMKQQASLKGSYIWNAIAELRTGVTPQDYRTQTPVPPLWYVARGTGNMYARSSWDASAFWSVFMSGGANGDHPHFAASNLIFSRGGDHLIVDPSNYGEPSTFETNAVTAEASVDVGSYYQTQSPFGTASLPWARGTSDGVYAARSDFAHMFDFDGTPSDITYAHREWVFFPEGEMVTIDRVHTSANSRSMYLTFHTNTHTDTSSLKIDNNTGIASGTVGDSLLAIHPVLLSGGTASISQPPVGTCMVANCSYPCGACNASRFLVDEYSIKVPGSWAVAIHAFDGLGTGEALAEVDSINDDNIDPAPKQNTGVIGASVYRSSKRNYVVASSAQDGASSATMTYGIPGDSAARHIVFDAPEDSTGSSVVTAVVAGSRCTVSITAGTGFAGHPLMFQVAAAADGCAVTEDTNVPAGTPPPGGGVTAHPPGSGGGSSGGCKCVLSGTTETSAGLALVLAVLSLAIVGRRRRR